MARELHAHERSLPDTIDRILIEIPSGNEFYGLRHTLLTIRRACGFTAPEETGIRWAAAQEALVDTFGDKPASEEWIGLVMKIWNAEL